MQCSASNTSRWSHRHARQLKMLVTVKCTIWDLVFPKWSLAFSQWLVIRVFLFAGMQGGWPKEMAKKKREDTTKTHTHTHVFRSTLHLAKLNHFPCRHTARVSQGRTLVRCWLPSLKLVIWATWYPQKSWSTQTPSKLYGCVLMHAACMLQCGSKRARSLLVSADLCTPIDVCMQMCGLHKCPGATCPQTSHPSIVTQSICWSRKQSVSHTNNLSVTQTICQSRKQSSSHAFEANNPSHKQSINHAKNLSVTQTI